jgi:ADP-ribose pyrophosphatase YjhB (NUDIX family)
VRRERPDAGGVEIIRFPAGVRRVRVTIEPGAPPAASAEVERVWAEMVAANPRLYNGPVLAVTVIDATAGVVRARRDTYQRLVVQPRIQTGVRQLAVTGVVARREGGRTRVLLGRRSAQTRMYAGMWELGPAGGVEPPPGGAHEIDHDGLVEQLRREAMEETGLDLAGDGMPLALVFDAQAESYDLLLRMESEREPRESKRWEYQEVLWVPVEELREFVRQNEAAVIPPTRAIIRELDLHSEI